MLINYFTQTFTAGRLMGFILTCGAVVGSPKRPGSMSMPMKLLCPGFTFPVADLFTTSMTFFAEFGITQKEQLEEETRKHHIVNEQLNDVEGALRHLKSEHTLLQMQLKTSQVQSLCSPSLSRARARARSLSCSLARSFALSQQSVYRDANRSI